VKMKHGNLDIGGCSNMTTARTRSSATDEADRAQRQAQARVALATRACRQAGIDLTGVDFTGIDADTATLAELARLAGIDPADPRLRAAAAVYARDLGVLGLDDTPVRRPGYCACGQPLTISSTSHQPGRHGRGRCADCTRSERLPGHG
jgi:hypothetical protein